jgi:hypothetical protein
VALIDNHPRADRLKRKLTGIPGLAGIPDQLLDELLEVSAAWVMDQVTGEWNGVETTEVRDGNGKNSMSLFHRPATSVSLVKVELPVLALNRVYTSDEIKLYELQGYLTVFTYKLAAEQASLHLDRMVYGNIFPVLPQCVTITYTYGFPQYDPAANESSLDGGATRIPGNALTPVLAKRLLELQEAAIADATASYLSQVAALGVGMVQAVSFDGASKTLNPGAYGPQVEALTARRDQLLERNVRRFTLASIG